MSSASIETRIVASERSVAGSPLVTDPDASVLGKVERLGRYVLLGTLGRGAFGRVWSAYDPKLDRKVAIKIVLAKAERSQLSTDTQPSADNSARALDLADPRPRARPELLAEAQHLAQLSHPNVVAIHDVGQVDDAPGDLSGVFIVMEQLEGPTLRDWMAERRHPLERVLAVFAEAGQGLAAAHRRGLVHLDFKPGNVMFGSEGRVRVLDFGLARAGLDGDPSAGQHAIVGTPAYMAPEQHAAQPADARADQFSFCVALWEALVGARPFEGMEGVEGVNDEVVDEAALRAAKLRGPLPLGRRGPLGSHLEAVLRRGLAPEPADRYPDMDALLAELLDDPRLRRRRLGLAGLAVVGVFAVGLSFALASGPVIQDDPCALPEGLFVDVWDEQRANEVAQSFRATELPFAQASFDEVAPLLDRYIGDWSDTRSEVCRASLERGEQSVEQMSEQLLCLDRQLQRVAGLSATMLDADPELVVRARDAVVQLEPPGQCRATVDEQVRGPAPVGEQKRTALLALEFMLGHAASETDLGQWERGLEHADQAIVHAREIDDGSGIARAELQRAKALRQMARYDEALEALRAGQASAVAAGDRTSALAILIDLVGLHGERGEYPVAEALALLAEAELEALPDARLAIQLALARGQLAQYQQRWAAAREQFELARARIDPTWPDAIAFEARCEGALANVGLASGQDLVGTAARYQRALDLWLLARGPHHPDVARTMINLSGLAFRQGDFDRALELIRGALDILDPILDADHKHRGVLHQNLGALYSMRGRYSLAIEHTREAARIVEASLGPDHPDLAGIQRNLAVLSTCLGRFDDALPLLERALAAYESELEPDDPRKLSAHAELADVLWWMGRDEAIASHAEAVDRLLATMDGKDLRRVDGLSSQALSHERRGEFELALPLVDEALASMIASAGEEHPDVARVRIQKARVLRGLDRRDEAREQLDIASAELEREDQPAHPFAWELHFERARLAQRDRPDEVEPEYTRALALAGAEEGSPVHLALVELELGEWLVDRDPARARELGEQAAAILASQTLRTQWRERAKALLE